MRRFVATLSAQAPNLRPLVNGSFDRSWGVLAAITDLRSIFKAESDAGACSQRLARLALLECWIREQAAPHSATGLGLPIAAQGMPRAKPRHEVISASLPIAAE
jgi:hypothetical protein